MLLCYLLLVCVQYAQELRQKLEGATLPTHTEKFNLIVGIPREFRRGWATCISRIPNLK